MGAEGRDAGFDGPSKNINDKVILLPENLGHGNWYDGGETYSKPESDEKEKREVLIVETEASDEGKEKRGSKEGSGDAFEVNPEDVLTPEQFADYLRNREEARRRNEETGSTHASGVISESIESSSNGSVGREDISAADREKERIEKRDKIKDLLVNAGFLSPNDEQNDKMRERLGVVFAELGHGYNSFSEIEATLRDGKKTLAQKENAEQDKGILGEAIFMAARELSSHDPSLEGKFYLGSRHIDGMLPSELKGLGGKILGDLMPESIDRYLNGLEVTRREADLDTESGRNVFGQKIRRTIENVGGLDFDNEGDIGTQDAVLTHLYEEKQFLEAEDDRRKEAVEVARDRKSASGDDSRKFDTRSDMERLDLSSPESVLSFCRKQLDTLENSSYRSNDISIGEVMRPINLVLDRVRIAMSGESGLVRNNPEELSFSDIYLEVTSRLALHDTAFYMEDSSFKISDRGGIMGAVDNIYREKRELSKDRLRFLLSPVSDSVDYVASAGLSKFGLPIAEAWDEIQKANFHYRDFLKNVVEDLNLRNPGVDEAKKDLWNSWLDLDLAGGIYGDGTTVMGRKQGYWFDDNDERRKAVDDFIIKKISKEVILKNGSRIVMDGSKALQLAQKLVSATGERSVFNFSLLNGDDFAEDIHFAYFRSDDGRKGKNVGAMSNRDIQSLTSGWLRSMSGSDDVTKELFSSQIDFEENKGKLTFSYYFVQMLTAKIHVLRGLFLENSPDPKKILASGVAYFNGVADTFTKVDPQLDLIKLPSRTDYLIIKKKENGSRGLFDVAGDEINMGGISIRKNNEGSFDVDIGDGVVKVSEKSREGKNYLRSKYVLGMLEFIATKPELGWTSSQVQELKTLLVDTRLTETAKPFLSESMWKWINEQIVANNGRKDFNFKTAFAKSQAVKDRRSFAESFWESIATGKKRKK